MDELPVDTQVLETVRHRVMNITRSLEGYYNHVFVQHLENEENTQLPSWNNVNHTYMALQTQLQGLQDFLNDKDLQDERAGRHDPKKFIVRTSDGERRKFLEQAHVFPTGAFPYAAAGPESVLGHLLRKRFEPPVEAWIEKERRAGKEFEDKGVMVDGELLRLEDFVKLWNDAAMAGQDALVKVFYEGAGQEDDDDDEEMEDEDEDEEGEEEDGAHGDKANGAAATNQMPLDHILSYMAQGYVP